MTEEIIICPYCKNKIDSSEVFCPFCGTDLLLNTKECPHCGREVDISATKCEHCGEWLEEEFQQTPNIKENKSSNDSWINKKYLNELKVSGYRGFVLKFVDNWLEGLSFLCLCILIYNAWKLIEEEYTRDAGITLLVVGVLVIFLLSWVVFSIIETRVLLKQIEKNTRRK